ISPPALRVTDQEAERDVHLPYVISRPRRHHEPQHVAFEHRVFAPENTGHGRNGDAPHSAERICDGCHDGPGVVSEPWDEAWNDGTELVGGPFDQGLRPADIVLVRR